jgi:hypothetical protein
VNVLNHALKTRASITFMATNEVREWILLSFFA